MRAGDALEHVQAAFERNFQRGTEVGAAVSVWQEGKEAISLCHGWRNLEKTEPWMPETMVLVWSATKGLSSASLLHALERAGHDLSLPVAAVWPEFAQCGKEAITIAEVMSHRAGLSALVDKQASILDHDAVAAALAAQAPLWDLPDGHGYGPRTYGFIVDELVRRLTGETLGDYFRREFGDPLGLDLWIGLPEALHVRAAQMLAARAGCSDAEEKFTAALTTPGTLTREAFSTPAGAISASVMNAPRFRSASLPSLGAIGTASSLAKFYAMLALGGEWEGQRFFAPSTMGWMTTRLTQGADKTLHTETAFSAGFMMDPLNPDGSKKRSLLGPSVTAFGHPGAGGSLAFADPENRVSFAYVMNQMETGVLPKSRAIGLVQALY